MRDLVGGAHRKEGKVADITGPGITDQWGVTCADLGASVIAPNGTLVSVFGDTFSGNRVGEGDWRSPVILIGTGDAGHPITYHRAGGVNPDFAQQLWRYTHRAGRSGRPRRGISTWAARRGFRPGCTTVMGSAGRGTMTRSTAGSTWCPLAFSATRESSCSESARSTSAIRANTPAGDAAAASGRGAKRRRLLTPPGESWGELSLRRLADSRWVLGGFVSSEYSLGYRVVKSPTAVRAAPLQHPVVGSDWDDEDQAGSRVAQLYGGCLLPGSKLDVVGGIGLVVSQWNTTHGWPYRAMQFRATLHDDHSGTSSEERVTVLRGSADLTATRAAWQLLTPALVIFLSRSRRTWNGVAFPFLVEGGEMKLRLAGLAMCGLICVGLGTGPASAEPKPPPGPPTPAIVPNEPHSIANNRPPGPVCGSPSRPCPGPGH